MLKQNIKFQTTILKQEKSQIFSTANIHKVPELKKTWIFSKMFLLQPKKSVMLYLSGIQIVSKKKGILLLSKKSNIALKFPKGEPIGARVTLNKKQSFLFLYFLVFNLFPKLDWISSFILKKEKQDFNFSINSVEVIKDFATLNYYFKANLKIRISLLCCRKRQKGKILWRLLKIPIR